MLSVVYSTIVPIFLIIAATLVVTHFVDVRPDVLSRTVIYLFAPALSLTTFANTDMALGDVGGLVAAAAGGTLLLALLAMLLARRLSLPRATASTFTLTVFVMNTGNFGIPFMDFAFGDAGLERAILITAGLALVLNTVGVYVASRGRSSVRVALRNVVATPLIYAVVAGLLLNVTATTLPLPLDRAVRLLADASIPVQLVVLGLQLREAYEARRQLLQRWRPVALASLARFGLGLAVGVGVALLLGFSGVTRDVYILEMAMPTGVFSAILSTEFGGDPDFAAATILVTTVASVGVLALVLALLA